MKKILASILVSFIVMATAVNSAEMQEYCYKPPFLTQSEVSPNIMFVVDYSGSMSWCAYNPNKESRDCCTDPNGCGWRYNGNEEGYFTPNKVYEYNSSKGYWQESTSSSYETCPKTSGGISVKKRYLGSCLNFLYMKRVDLLRWAVTGGKPSSCVSNSPKCDPNNSQYNPEQCHGEMIKKCDPEIYDSSSNGSTNQLSCDSDGCFLVTDGGKQVKVPWSRIKEGLVFQFRKLHLQPRIGALIYQGNSIVNKVYIGDFTASNNFDGENPYKNFITVINFTPVGGATPTAPALWDAYHYFAQEEPKYGGLTPQQG